MEKLKAFFKDLIVFYRGTFAQLWRKRPKLKFQGPTNLNVLDWSKNRIVSLAICVVIYAVLIGATLYSSVSFWGAAFKTHEVGIGFALLVDGLGLATLVFRVTRIQFPLNWLRHTLPLTTIIPVYEFAYWQTSDIWLSTFVCLVVMGFSFILQHHIENLFISPEELAREKVMANAQGLLNEQLRRQEVDRVLGTFAQESKALHAATKQVAQLGDGQLRREEFRRHYKVAVKFITVAFQAYKAGQDFSVYCDTAK